MRFVIARRQARKQCRVVDSDLLLADLFALFPRKGFVSDYCDVTNDLAGQLQLKIALSMAILRRKPQDQDTKTYVHSLQSLYRVSQENWRRKAVCVEAAYVDFRQRYLLEAINTLQTGTQEGSHAAEKATPIEKNETPAEPISKAKDVTKHVNFLRTVASVASKMESFMVFENIPDEVFSAIVVSMDALSSSLPSELPVWPFATIWNFVEHFISLLSQAGSLKASHRASLLDAATRLTSSLFTCLLAHDSWCSADCQPVLCPLDNTPVKPQEWVRNVIACLALSQSDCLVAVLHQSVAAIQSMSEKLRRSKSFADIDIIEYENMAHVFTLAESILTRPAKFNQSEYNQRIRSIREELRSSLEDSLMFIQEPHPLYALSVWNVWGLLAE